MYVCVCRQFLIYPRIGVMTRPTANQHYTHLRSVLGVPICSFYASWNPFSKGRNEMQKLVYKHEKNLICEVMCRLGMVNNKLLFKEHK